MIFIFTIYQSHGNRQSIQMNYIPKLLKELQRIRYLEQVIGNILEMSNIHASLKEFDDTEKVINSIYTPGGNQHVTI